jgi:hypothetical protein
MLATRSTTQKRSHPLPLILTHPIKDYPGNEGLFEYRRSGKGNEQLSNARASCLFFDPHAKESWKPKISYEWVSGSDPFNNQPKQPYQQIVFQVKFNYRGGRLPRRALSG